MAVLQMPDGQFRCTGASCGTPLVWMECEPGEGADGLWACLDCGSDMYASRPLPAAAARRRLTIASHGGTRP